MLCDACWLGLSWVHDARTLSDVVRAWGRSNGLVFRRCPWPGGVADVKTRSVAHMEPVLASVIHHLKYRGRRRVAHRLGRLMARAVLSDPNFRGCDGLVPVPLRREKELERGYNPATLLGMCVSSIVGIPLLGGVLGKTSRTRSQTEMQPLERISNPRGSFGVLDCGEVTGKRLLVIDDVMTSGSTIAAAAAALLEAGSGRVLALTAARAPSAGFR